LCLRHFDIKLRIAILTRREYRACKVADLLALGSSSRSSAVFRESESLPDPKILRHAQSERGALYEFLQVLTKSSFKRLLLRTAHWRAYAMSSTKSTESLKDSECEKGQLAIWPPISYVPPTDLHSSTESEIIKVKLPDGTTVSVKAFSSGNNEENILHWAAILRLFDQKGLKLDVEVLAKAAKDLMGVLETIQKLLGKKKTTSDADQLELEETKQLVSDAKAEFLKAMQKPFDLVRQLNRRGENPMGQSCFGDV